MEELDTWILGRENPCFWGLWGKDRKGRDSVCARLASLAGIQSPVNRAHQTPPENAAERVSIAGVRPGEGEGGLPAWSRTVDVKPSKKWL